MTRKIPPMKGLTFLTTNQVLQLDARMASLAAYAERTGRGVQLGLIINDNGRLVEFAEPMLIDKVRP